MIFIPRIEHTVHRDLLHHLSEVIIDLFGIVLHMIAEPCLCADSTAANYECGEHSEGKACVAEPLLYRFDGLPPTIVLISVCGWHLVQSLRIFGHLRCGAELPSGSTSSLCRWSLPRLVVSWVEVTV